MGSLRRHISFGPDGDVIDDELPAACGLAELASAYILIARRRGLLNRDFFARLVAAYPRRAPDIKRVSENILSARRPTPLEQTRETADPAGRWFSLRFRLGALHVAIAFSVVGLTVGIGLLAQRLSGRPIDMYSENHFTRASMVGPRISPNDPNRPLAADLAIEPVSMLIMFNRLHTADKLQHMLNKTPGQFSRVDIDRDGRPDPLIVVVQEIPEGQAVVVHARASTGEYVVATLLFDVDWEFLGHYDGPRDGPSSTVSAPLSATVAAKPP